LQAIAATRLIACHLPRRVFAATNFRCAFAVKFFPANSGLFGYRAALVCRAGPAGRKTAMNSFIGFAEIAGAIIAALGLALGLQWVGLYGLTSLMPMQRDQPRNSQRS
jgi:hypothetical protein